MGRFNKSNLIRGISYLQRNGFSAAFYNALERLQRDRDEASFIDKLPSGDELTKIVEEQRNDRLAKEVKISILIPAYETDYELFMKTLDSVAMQSYGNWELCIADASKTDDRRQIVRDFCEKWNLSCSDRFGKMYDKVIYKHLESNLGISGNTNQALEMATGDYIALLDHDDLLDPRALYEFVKELSSRKDRIYLAYTDEDKVSEDGNRYFDFHIKPDFDPALLCTNNYICHFTFVETNYARGVGGFHSEYDGAQDHDFFLRCTESLEMNQVLHIPKFLYHWRSTASSTAENPNAKLYAYEAGKRAVTDHLKRIGIDAKVSNTAHLGFFEIEYENLNRPVLIMDEKEFAQCDDDSLKVRQEKYIMITSSSLKEKSPDTVRRMLSCMNLDYVGAVTGKIIGKNGRIESAGYDKIECGELRARFGGLNSHFSGYLHRADIAQLVGAFTEECVLLRKDAVESFHPHIVLKKDFHIYYEPKAEFKRKHL